MSGYTARGFRIFLDRGESEHEPYVVESSLAFEGPHVRIYGGGDGSEQVHLSYEQAKAVRAALDAFIAEAEAGSLTEKMAAREATDG